MKSPFNQLNQRINLFTTAALLVTVLLAPAFALAQTGSDSATGGPSASVNGKANPMIGSGITTGTIARDNMDTTRNTGGKVIKNTKHNKVVKKKGSAQSETSSSSTTTETQTSGTMDSGALDANPTGNLESNKNK